MTSAQWLLQDNHPGFVPVAESEAVLSSIGRPAFRLSLSRDPAEPGLPAGFDRAAPVICYGPSFVPRCLGWHSIRPGIFFDPATFRWSAFAMGWSGLMLNDDAQLHTMADILSLPVATPSVFARPDADSKAFDGGVHTTEALKDTIRANLAADRSREDTLVVLAEPKRLDAEWRTFLVNGEVVGASSYRMDGRPALDHYVPHHVVDLAFEAAAMWAPGPIFVLDIGQVGARVGVVEANCFNAARLYNADPQPIFRAVSEFVEAYRASPDLQAPTPSP
jgi:hypothetical protein